MDDLRASLIVRDASDADISAIATIYATHVLTGVASFEEVVPDAAEMTARRAAVLAMELPYLVADLDGQVAGFAYAGSYRARPAYRHTVEDSVYVAPDALGRGVGRALLAEVIARCEAGPWRQMIAVIGDSANAGSIAVHARLGFQMIGTLPAVGFKFGRWVDCVLMQRALGLGAAEPPSEPFRPQP